MWAKQLLFPWITLSILYIGFYGRVLRSSLLEVQNEDYVRTARAKGLTERRVLLRHVLRTSLITFVSLFGLDFGALVGGGALLTEVVFGLPGVGQADLRLAPEPRPAGDHGDGHVRGVLRRARERASSTSSTPGSTRGCGCLSEPLLEVRDLRVSFRTEDGLVRAVDGVSFTLDAGQVLGIVGESGSGKSVTMMSIMRLIRDPNAIFEGEVIYKGRDLLKLSQRRCAACAAPRSR